MQKMKLQWYIRWERAKGWEGGSEEGGEVFKTNSAFACYASGRSIWIKFPDDKGRTMLIKSSRRMCAVPQQGPVLTALEDLESNVSSHKLQSNRLQSVAHQFVHWSFACVFCFLILTIPCSASLSSPFPPPTSPPDAPRPFPRTLET